MSRRGPTPLVLATLLGLLAGCFRHQQAYRGAFTGRVVDHSGRPVPGATVVVCTTDGWHPFTGCPRRAEAWTDPDGRFQFSPIKEPEWCCLGEAPRPTTHLTACAHDGTGRFLLASSVLVDATGSTEPRVAVTPPDHPETQTACIAPE